MPSRTRKEDDVIVPNVSSAELESALKRVKEEEGEKTRLVALTMRESNKIQIPVASLACSPRASTKERST